jgi:hypothetical protein
MTNAVYINEHERPTTIQRMPRVSDSGSTVSHLILMGYTLATVIILIAVSTQFSFSCA